MPRLLCALISLLSVGCAFSRTQSETESGRTLALVDQVPHYGTRTREPMVVQHPNGTLFVAGYAVSTQAVWKSQDLGKTWAPVTFGPNAAGLLGNSDTDLAVAADGTLYFASMTFDRATSEGRQIAVAVSRDAGATWVWSAVSKGRFDDRPWLKVAPDGTVQLIWNDGSGVQHRISRDRGATWITMPRISARGGSSHLALGPEGQLAVRVAPVSASGNRYDPDIDMIRVSTDAGATWQTRPVPGHPTWSATDLSRWVEPLAWDARGALFAAWTERTAVWLARSTDQGATWNTWQLAGGTADAYYPFLVAQKDGEIAVTWHAGKGDALRWFAARVTLPYDAKAPRSRISKAQQLDAFYWPADQPAVAPIRSSAGEYLAAIFLRDGGLGVVTPVQSKPHDGFSWWRFVQ